MNKADRRIRRTQKALADALIALTLERGYDNLTIRDITERADVGYATFFRHYADKDALLLDMLDSVVEELDELTRQCNDLRGRSEGTSIFQHVQAHARLYRVLMHSPSANHVLIQLQKKIAENILRDCAPLRDYIQAQVPLPIIANHMAAGVLALIRWWLDADQPYSIAEMGSIYEKLIFEPAYQLLGLDPEAVIAFLGTAQAN